VLAVLAPVMAVAAGLPVPVVTLVEQPLPTVRAVAVVVERSPPLAVRAGKASSLFLIQREVEMSTFARVGSDGFVEDITVVPDEHTDSGGVFLSETLGLGGRWVEANFDTRKGIHFSPVTGMPSSRQDLALRGNYPEIGTYRYDEDLDLFIPPAPDPSWVLTVENACWSPPVASPTDGQYEWSSESESWVEVPRPYPSWVLATFGALRVWVPPTYPDDEFTGDHGSLVWDEESLSWVEITA